MNDTIIRVMVVDDHSMVHIGIAGMLEAFDGIELAGQAVTGEEGIAKVQELNPDVVLMDLKLPDINGIEAMRQIKVNCPKVQVLILTSYEISADIHGAMAAGAMGYLLKNVTATELERAIRFASQGHIILAPEAVRALVEYSVAQKSVSKDLTDRELQVLNFLARGLSNPEIAAQLVVSPFTIKAHVSNILAKLEVSTRAEAAAYAVQHHLVNLD